MRAFAVLPLLLLAGCGALPAGTDHVCTEIGASPGIGVDVAPGLAAHSAEVEVCEDGECRSSDAVLMPATEPVEEECDGTSPDDVCSARMRPTGGAAGFAQLSDLGEETVEVTLTLTDDAGRKVVSRTLAATPQWVYPNGPDCGAAGPQIQLAVDADGRVTVRH
ncbi:hypothetical protein [Saccharomonospora xinjiangensis]|uniref:Uncharacterized protein n=1 Tax=Saccharomonospora xinjiangensis XJ-54 TaxID=882086 RepID=I0V3A7_9PSEU|nr:hypothetical protein [Saccharomonospora xinjiangensis]EID54610.1 hypothetical protein SacxiDRAFT_2384 [Saccharomonospora xinjiangensis XJ-54]